MNVYVGFSFVPQNAIDTELCLRIATTTGDVYSALYRFN